MDTKRLKGSLIKLWVISIIISLSLITAEAQLLKDSQQEEVHPKIDTLLTKLQNAYEKDPEGGRQFAEDKEIEIKGQDKITVFIIAEKGKTASEIDLSALESFGGKVIKGIGNVLKADIPIDQIRDIADHVRGISFIKLPDRPHSQLIQSEGVNNTNATYYHNLGYTGAGVKIGVIDSGFNNLDSTIKAGELPNNLLVVDCTKEDCEEVPSPGDSFGSGNHGTAVAEVIHDMAPDAQLYLIRINDYLDLWNATDLCILNEIRIINASLAWMNANFYDGECYMELVGSPTPTCSVNKAFENGILWVNSIGNYAQKHYEGIYNDSNADGFHDQPISLYAVSGSKIVLYLTWDAWPQSDQDYNLYLTDAMGNKVQESINLQTGTQIPTEYISYSVSQTGTFYIKIEKFNAATDHHHLELYSNNHNLTPSITESSVVCPADAEGAFAVGAIHHSNWALGPIGAYSSQGPTNDGRIKPEIVAPSYVSTYAKGDQNFSGTSAAAPHVAGAAALILSANPNYSLSDLWNSLITSAIDMDLVGQDNLYGYGRLNFPVELDQSSPDPPLVLSSVPNVWTNVNSFGALWTNPFDPSAIIAAWFKIGSPPASASDGTRAEGNDIQSLSGLILPREGEHNLYVWLEDGAGNKDHNKRAQATLRYDGTPPASGTISINNDASTTDSFIVTLNNLGATDLSGPSQMEFSNDGITWSDPEPYDPEWEDWNFFEYGGNPHAGQKTAYVKFKDNAGNWSEIFSDTILLPMALVYPLIDGEFASCSYYDLPLFQWDLTETFKSIEIHFSTVSDFSQNLVKVKGPVTDKKLLMKSSTWKKILLLPGLNGGTVYWKVIGTKADKEKTKMNSYVQSFDIRQPEPVGAPSISSTKRGTLPTLTWENNCNTKFKAWFYTNPLFYEDPKLTGIKKKALSFTISNPEEQEVIFTQELSFSQWTSIRKLVGDMSGSPIYWHVESWDGVKRYSKTEQKTFVLTD